MEWLGDFFLENKQISTFLLQSYSFSLLTAPLIVEETLSQTQYQSDEDYENISYANLHLKTLNEGVWQNIRAIVESEYDGTIALLKGHITDGFYNFTFQGLRPILEESLNDALDIFDDNNPSTNILSHVILGGLLSPLELVKTRVIVESSLSTRKTYYNSIHALTSIPLEEKSSFLVMYSPRLLLPSIFIHALSPMISYFTTYLIEVELDLNPTYTPLYFKIASVLAIGLKVLITTPFEMARKRLMIQRIHKTENESQNTNPLKETCVQVSPIYYTGIFNCIKKIVLEEGKLKKRKRNLNNIQSDTNFNIYKNFSTVNLVSHPTTVTDSGFSDNGSNFSSEKKKNFKQYWAGFKSLYRGFWSRYTIEVLRYFLKELDDDLMDEFY
ncbi:hypothetical protein HK099_002680 [Clydaea vesicula]|uniref:Mitochondrial carrier n=1 Tax=Clydaea vesicula TaxID=447962 RepID=A0AAD5TTB4_9FUNG|nr:hypothetical protein HK099_002680 [Clydaea vesicula]